jgi:hypothetical protein
VLLGASGTAAAQSTQEHKLSWLQGCWAVVSQERAIEEQWMAPRGKTMLGSSRTVEGAKLVGYEYMMIRVQGNKYAIEVRPLGQAARGLHPGRPHRLERRLRESEARLPAEDRYSRTGDNAISAWIEGSRNGVSRRFEVPVPAGGLRGQRLIRSFSRSSRDFYRLASGTGRPPPLMSPGECQASLALASSFTSLRGAAPCPRPSRV